MPGMAPLSAPMVDHIKAEAYAAGRSDGRVEGKVEGMAESRMIVEEEAAIRAAVSNAAYQPRNALPPRVIQAQRAPGIRTVNPDDVLREVEDNLREEQIRRLEQLRLEDRLHEEELERREQARRRRVIDQQWREESDYYDYPEPRSREPRYYDRQRGVAMDYMRRREPSLERHERYDNPFNSPRLERRFTAEPAGRGYY